VIASNTQADIEALTADAIRLATRLADVGDLR
jgi:hypothetical protein